MPTFTKKSNIVIISATIAFAALLTTINLIYNIVPVSSFSMILANYIVTGLGACIGIYGAFRIGVKNFVGKGVGLLGLTSLFSFIGYVLWDYYDFILGVEIPYPSLADVSWTLGIPAAILGVAFILRIYQPQIRGRFLLEAVALSAVATAIVLYFIGLPDLSESTITTGMFDILYTLTDIVWLALAFISVRIAGGKIFGGLLVYTIAIVVLALGDILFAIRIANETYFYGDIADLTLLLGWALATAGIYLTAQTFSTTPEPHA